MKKTFLLQKKIVRIMLGKSSRCTCKGLFEKSDILLFPCEYIFSLMMFTINNFDNFQMNSAVHGMNTRSKHQLHRPTVNLSCIQNGVFNSCTKIFSSLTPYILQLKAEKFKFKAALREYLITHMFYSVEEFVSSSQTASHH
jgi:hypothetical protein